MAIAILILLILLIALFTGLGAFVAKLFFIGFIAVLALAVYGAYKLMSHA
jgi:hypothetical protein